MNLKLIYPENGQKKQSYKNTDSNKILQNIKKSIVFRVTIIHMIGSRESHSTSSLTSNDSKFRHKQVLDSFKIAGSSSSVDKEGDMHLVSSSSEKMPTTLAEVKSQMKSRRLAPNFFGNSKAFHK